MPSLQTIDALYRQILGPFPERVPLNLETLETVDCGDYTRSLIAWDNDATERVEAYLLRPKGFPGKRPAIALFHGHGDWALGKKMTAGVDPEPGKSYMGPDLARRGFVTICGDAIGWGPRQNKAPKPNGVMYERVLAMRLLAEGRCMANQYVWDAMRELDVLQALPDVDGERLGAGGVSMGSGHTWLTAMVEPRIKVLVAVSSFYTYKALYAPPIQHCYMNYLPNVLKYGLETYDLFQLIAPRPFLMINGVTEEQDPPEATRELYEKAKPAWEAAGAGDEFQLIFHEAGHGFTPETREMAYQWFLNKLAARQGAAR